MRDDLERLKKIRNHRGLRTYWGLRVRGQHTKTTGRYDLIETWVGFCGASCNLAILKGCPAPEILHLIYFRAGVEVPAGSKWFSSGGLMHPCQ